MVLSRSRSQTGPRGHSGTCGPSYRPGGRNHTLDPVFYKHLICLEGVQGGPFHRRLWGLLFHHLIHPIQGPVGRSSTNFSGVSLVTTVVTVGLPATRNRRGRSGKVISISSSTIFLCFPNVRSGRVLSAVTNPYHFHLRSYFYT